MTNAEAVKRVEDAANNDGINVYQVRGITPGDIKEGEHPDVPAGKYRFVEVTFAVPAED